VWRYVNRLWRMVTEPAIDLAPLGAAVPDVLSPGATEARRIIHKTIRAVTEDLETFRFNRAVAHIRELSNALSDIETSGGADAGFVLREGYEAIALLLGPLAPHLAEELHERLGRAEPLYATPWPKADPALVVDERVTVAVQVNGKLRGQIELPRDAATADAEAAALALPAVARAAQGKPPRKVIVVPNRIVNVVL
jgi:leucyl-tRNA synthetase